MFLLEEERLKKQKWIEQRWLCRRFCNQLLNLSVQSIAEK